MLQLLLANYRKQLAKLTGYANMLPCGAGLQQVPTLENNVASAPFLFDSCPCNAWYVSLTP